MKNSEFPWNRFYLSFPSIYLGNQKFSEFGDDPYRKFGIDAPTQLIITKQSGHFSISFKIFGFGFTYSRQTDY